MFHSIDPVHTLHTRTSVEFLIQFILLLICTSSIEQIHLLQS